MELQLVVFNLGEEDFGVAIDQVREIIRMTGITTVPKAPASVLGVINLRGKVIPVVSLRERFGFEAQEPTEATRIVVCDMGDQTVGFVVDAVTEVLRVGDEAIEPAPQAATGVESRFISGIGKVDDRLIIVLDLEQVFNVQEVAGLIST